VRASLEDSLRWLRLDRVDIALIHDPDDFMAQALDSAYPALAELRADGVVGAIGIRRAASPGPAHSGYLRGLRRARRRGGAASSSPVK
jgi:D-threo-aldose 1-dehydrogenase